MAPSSGPGSRDPVPIRVALVVATWHREVTQALEHAARAELAAEGVPADAVFSAGVPGAFELPLAAAWLANTRRFDAIVALGCVIRGQTPHFEHVSRAAVDGLMRVALESSVPVGLGLITAETLDQARERSGPARGKGGNKAVEAVQAALSMARWGRALDAATKGP